MKTSLEDIRKMDDPEAKLRLLAEFEREAKHEIEEATILAREEMRELERKHKLEGIEVPRREVNIEALFGEADTLEKKANIPMDERGVEYTISKDLERLHTMSSYEHLDEHQMMEVAKIEGKVNAFKYISASKEIDEKLTASQSIISNIKKYVMG